MTRNYIAFSLAMFTVCVGIIWQAKLPNDSAASLRGSPA
jgi:hypothetical protein